MANTPFRIKLDRNASKRAIDLMRDFPDKMAEVNAISLFRIGTQVRSDAGKAAPFKTGTLRRSLTMPNHKNAIFKEKKNSVEVGTNLVYAAAQNYGYRAIKATHYLTKALQKQKDGGAAKIYSEELDDIIK